MAVQSLRTGIEQALGRDASLYSFPGDTDFEQKVNRYNLNVPTTPAVVTFPKTTEQIAALVQVATQYDLKVQARSGGHSYGNFSCPNGGMLINMKYFTHFSMDTQTWRARIGAGFTLGELDKHLYEPYKRAMAHGVCPQVGIGGHATIGGLGPSSRLWGAALDHIEEVEVVLSDGSIVRASESSHADLFWALRGAGAGFGIITEFVVRTEEAPEELVQHSISFTTGTWAEIAAVFKAWQRFVSAPDLSWKWASTANISNVGLVITGTFFGSHEEYAAITSRVDFPGNASHHTVVTKGWLAAVEGWWGDIALQMGGGVPVHSYAKTLTFNGAQIIPDPVVDSMFKYIHDVPKGTLVWFAIFDLAGGQINAVAPEATAYAHRDALFYLQSYAVDFKAISATTKAFLNGLNNVLVDGMRSAGETTDFGAYPGYVDLELARPQEEYWRYNLPRLERIKTLYDPRDVFSNPQSVRSLAEVTVNPKTVVESDKPVVADVVGKRRFIG